MSQITVLIVDDDPAVVVFVADQLQYLGYSVDIARNGLSGLEKAKSIKPDLIVLDVMMPLMSGFEVCHLLKRLV